MPSPWSSRREVSPETSRLLIERAHDEFVGGNDADPRLRQVRGLVQDSWRRSLAHLVGPDGTPPLDLTSEELEAYRSAHPLAGAIDMIGADGSWIIGAVSQKRGRAAPEGCWPR